MIAEGIQGSNAPSVTAPIDVSSQYLNLNGMNFDVAANVQTVAAPDDGGIELPPTRPDFNITQPDVQVPVLDSADAAASSESLPHGWAERFPDLSAASYSVAAPASNGAWTFGSKLANGGWRIGMAEIASGSQLMQDLAQLGEKTRVEHVLQKFNLDASSVPDVLAARAYIWAGTISYTLGSPVNFVGDGTPWQAEAGQEAVMRIELANPGTTYHADLALQGSIKAIDKDALLLLQMAADQGIQDTGLARGASPFSTIAIPDGDNIGGNVLAARPTGAPDYLQADSKAARAAVAADEMHGSWEGHHLVPAASYGNYLDWARAAFSDGWQPNGPSNIIALPADTQTQAMVGDLLPIHRGSHGDYNFQTNLQLTALIRASGIAQPTLRDGMLARGIFETVQYENRLQILTGQWHPRVH